MKEKMISCLPHFIFCLWHFLNNDLYVVQLMPVTKKTSHDAGSVNET